MLWRAGELLEGRREFAHILRDEARFRRVTLQAGGHGAQWGESLALSVEELCSAGQCLPLSAGDLALVAEQAVCSTTEATRLLGCTRQNVNDLVHRGRPSTLKTDGRTRLFLRSELLDRR